MATLLQEMSLESSSLCKQVWQMIMPPVLPRINVCKWQSCCSLPKATFSFPHRSQRLGQGHWVSGYAQTALSTPLSYQLAPELSKNTGLNASFLKTSTLSRALRPSVYVGSVYVTCSLLRTLSHVLVICQRKQQSRSRCWGIWSRQYIASQHC